MFNLFSEGRLDDYLQHQKQQVLERISSSSLQDLEEPDFIQKKVDGLKVSSPSLDFDSVYATSYEKEIPARLHPQAFFMDSNSSYKRQIIVYHLPVSGSMEVLKYRPSTSILWSEEVYSERSHNSGLTLCFEIINFGNDGDRVKTEFNAFKEKTTTQLGHIQNQVNGFNDGLADFIKERVAMRKKELEEQRGVLDDLGVPVRD